MSSIAKTVGKRLRGCRLALGYSQERLAERAGLHPTYIGQVERGEKNLTIESLERIARALEVPLSGLFQHIEDAEAGENYPLMAYDLLAAKNAPDRARLYAILAAVEDYAGKG